MTLSTTAAAAAQQATQPLREQQQHPFRVRTITAFLELPADSSQWEAEVAAAGRFLAHAQQHLESLGAYMMPCLPSCWQSHKQSMWHPSCIIAAAVSAPSHKTTHTHIPPYITGYEVQTARIATQPFTAFLPGSSSRSSGSTDAQQQQQQQQQDQEQKHQQHSSSLDDVMVTNAVLLESLASQQGIPLVSLGSSSDPQHLAVIPRLITATQGTSCTFALSAEADWGLAYQVAEVVMRIAGQTGVWCVRWAVGADAAT